MDVRDRVSNGGFTVGEVERMRIEIGGLNEGEVIGTMEPLIDRPVLN
jgi:hypothetical protein